MITCTVCGAGMKQVFKSITNPEKDKFKCSQCNNVQLRYAGTVYETAEERTTKKEGV